MKKSLLFLLSLMITFHAFSQFTVEGYTFESNNRGFLFQVKIVVQDAEGSKISEVVTNDEGFFTLNLPGPGKYSLTATKDIFKTSKREIHTNDVDEEGKIYLKIEMERKPGYLFDATLAEKRGQNQEEVDAITGSLIEVFNNTTGKEELVLTNHPNPTFAHTFERGNHYTLMIRKEGYLAKRIEAFVNIEGCILCIDGVKNVGPGVTDNLTSGFEMGTLLANIEMEKAALNTVIQIENIYYDLNKWDIRPDAAKELDKVVTLMNDNPEIIVELGSHTDARGSKEYNQKLSSNRAQAAVDYITKTGGIAFERIKAKGYGESALTNKCADGVQCTEEEHQQNRRTELKIIGFEKMGPQKSLKEIILGKKEEEDLLSYWNDDEIVRIPEKQSNPKDLERSEPISQQEETSNKKTLPFTNQGSNQKFTADFIQIPAYYNGWKIEILQSDSWLMAIDESFKAYENIAARQSESGKIIYYLGDFKNEKVATWFLRNTMKEDFPEAKLVHFKDGIPE
jgi:outer membrane protein OmpA-like peptidoglycan-associated protein